MAYSSKKKGQGPNLKGTLKIQFSDIIIFSYVLLRFTINFSSVGLPGSRGSRPSYSIGGLGRAEDGKNGLTGAYIA